jgi:hypothetical protein
VERLRDMNLVHGPVRLEMNADSGLIRYQTGFFQSESLANCLNSAERVSSWDLRGEGASQNLRIQASPGTVELAR